MSSSNGYKHLEYRAGTRYQQFFVKGKSYTAERIYRETIGLDPRTPEQVAQDFDLPLDAVLEAIDYCERNADLLRKEREEKLARFAEFERRHPPILPPDYQPQP